MRTTNVLAVALVIADGLDRGPAAVPDLDPIAVPARAGTVLEWIP